MKIEELNKQIKECKRCRLYKTRKMMKKAECLLALPGKYWTNY